MWKGEIGLTFVDLSIVQTLCQVLTTISLVHLIKIPIWDIHQPYFTNYDTELQSSMRSHRRQKLRLEPGSFQSQNSCFLLSIMLPLLWRSDTKVTHNPLQFLLINFVVSGMLCNCSWHRMISFFLDSLFQESFDHTLYLKQKIDFGL